MLETWVDLTYRGISLARRIKLTEIRPTSGYLELPAPMPVGSELTLAGDDGVVLTATVAWVYEQVAGSDRVPGMAVVPKLAADPTAAWWSARVTLSDEAQPALRPSRSRPVTVRPRSQSQSQPPRAAAPTSSIAADLAARVAAAAGIAAARPAEATPLTTASVGAQPLAEPAAATGAEPSEPRTRTGDREPMIRRTGEHAVVDDGNATIIMDAVDPAQLGLDVARAPEASSPGDEGTTNPDAVRLRSDDGDAAGDGDTGDDDDAGERTEIGVPPAPDQRSGANGSAPPTGRKRRRKR